MSEKYEPCPPKRGFQRFINLFIIAGTAALWFFHKELQLDTSVLFVITGVALMIILLSVQNRRKEAENFRTAQELRKLREDMDEVKYYDSIAEKDDTINS